MPKFLDNFSARRAFILVIVLGLIYSALTIFTPQSQNTYHLGHLELIELQFTVILPVLCIWLIATYGAVRFKQYSHIIRKSPDGRALRRITDGVAVLVASFIIQGIIGTLPKYAVGTPAVWWLVLIYNHLPMLLALVAVANIYRGSEALSKLAHAKISPFQVAIIIMPFLALSEILAALFYSNVTHSIVNGIPNFAAPGKLPFFTIVLPYLVIWFLGLVSILNISNYITKVKGAIYKQAMKYLSSGIMGVLSFTIFLQFFNLSATFLAKLPLRPLLVIIYLLIIFYGIGFILIAMGARKLTRIEAVV